MGRAGQVAPAIFKCAPPDSGNVEMLLRYGSACQRRRWLEPLASGDSRSAFPMTEPGVAGSDPTRLAAVGREDGEEFVIDGTKWFTTGVLGAELIFVMCVSDPEAEPHRRAGILLVPAATPGMELVRNVGVMGHAAGPGHGELRFTRCRVPAGALLGGRGRGFEVAQHRLGPGRLHHAMRAIGQAEWARALELTCARAEEREVFGERLADKQMVQDFIATSRIEIDQTRFLVLAAAAELDRVGAAAARTRIAMAKVAAAQLQQRVLDRAIQVYGALGLSDDAPLAAMWRFGRPSRPRWPG
ncbi:MAG: acyl-CoA dehydrogenase family protein [Solirubrobacterales bacterium]